jgi:diguanylate cyclase (GGDEF)-like protein
LYIGKSILSLSLNIPDLLKTVPLFSGLSNEILIKHLDLSKRLSLAAGQTLLAPGDVNENIYIVLSGRLRVCSDKTSSDIVAMFGEGESVSEMSILNGSKALDYLIADTNCELLCVDVATIWSLVKSSHHAALNMLNVLSKPVAVNRHRHQNVEQQHGYAGLNHVDELTGLYNRQWIFKIFERQIRRLSITHDHSVLMMVSIDNFDQYGQRHGQLGGDQALRTIAQTLLTCLRPEDHSGRYFDAALAVFMSRTTLEEGRIAGQRLLLQAGKADVVTPSGDVLPHVTVSIGLVEIVEGSSMQLLFDQATEALNRAVEAGGNCIKS